MRALVLLLAGCSIPNVHFTSGGDDAGDASTIDAAPGSYVWVRSLSAMLPTGVADGPGGIGVSGYLYATADLGGTPLTSAGGSDFVLAGFAETDAAHLYSVRYGDVGNEFPFMDTEDSTSASIVDGVSYGTVNLGLGQAAGGGGGPPIPADGFIGRYANGVPSWVVRIVGPGEDKILCSAMAPNSFVYGGGWFEQTTNFNNGTMLTSVGGRDLFLGRFNSFTGAVDLVKTYGGIMRDEISGIAVVGSDVVLAGFFDDSFSFGGTAATLTQTHGGLDFYVAKLAPDGSGIWAVAYGGPGDDRDVRVVADPAGDLYVTGTYTTTISFGTTTLTSAGGTDHFIAKLSGTDGSPVWAVSLGSALDENAGHVAVDRNGHVAFAGFVRGQIAGEQTMGGNDGVIEELDAASGALIWRKIYSTPGDDGASYLKYSVNGDLFAFVAIAGPFDFGMPIIGAPDPAAVLLRIRP